MITKYEEFEKINEGLNIFSTKGKPYLELMKRIFSDKIYKRKLTDIEFKYLLLLPQTNSNTSYERNKVWDDFYYEIVYFLPPGRAFRKLTNKIIMNYCNNPKYSKFDYFLESVINKIKDKYYPYESFEDKLDNCVKNKDMNKFVEIYNKGEKEWQKEYNKKRPENKDIIDGMNVGLFSLKTNEEWNLFKGKENEPLNILDVVIYKQNCYPGKRGWIGVIINRRKELDPIYEEPIFGVEFENGEIIHCISSHLKKVPKTNIRARKLLTKIENNIPKFTKIFVDMDDKSKEEYIKNNPDNRDFQNIQVGKDFKTGSITILDLVIYQGVNNPHKEGKLAVVIGRAEKRLGIDEPRFKIEFEDGEIIDCRRSRLLKVSPFFSRNKKAKKLLSKVQNDIEKDIVEFSKSYNSWDKEFKEEYVRKRPENKDIIDGINIGLFSLKTNEKR